MKSSPLVFDLIAKCSKSKARTSVIRLRHANVDAPVFMPVGTQGTMKGVHPEQLEDLGCQIMLSNTYHLALRPGDSFLRENGGLHSWIGWENGALLTDSGGFQMVSLLSLAKITEEGVEFESPHKDGTKMMLTPERSIEIQNAIGADIIMQLDDVVHTLTTGERVEEAMWRSVRWLDRCLKAHGRPEDQALFPIIQGGTDLSLRALCIHEMVKRNALGYAIGGLSGGEEKDIFWKLVSHCTDLLPKDKPVYCMGVGFAVDLLVCVALGVDMFDCVYPTRTARFGTAITWNGEFSLKKSKFASDQSPLDDECSCITCKNYSKAYLHSIAAQEDSTVGCHLLSIHNIAFQLDFMKKMRQSIKDDKFESFCKQFLAKWYSSPDVSTYPSWVIDSLSSVNIVLS